MNPRDIMTDAIHNFHPQYQQYTQYSSTASTKVIPVPVPVLMITDNSRQIRLQHIYHGQLASIISGKAQMSQILTHNCWYTREVTRVKIAYLDYCLFWLLLLIIAYTIYTREVTKEMAATRASTAMNLSLPWSRSWWGWWWRWWWRGWWSRSGWWRLWRMLLINQWLWWCIRRFQRWWCLWKLRLL